MVKLLVMCSVLKRELSVNGFNAPFLVWNDGEKCFLASNEI